MTTTTTEIKQVGYIGLGIMGRPAALNILRGGYALGVWARRAQSLPPLTEAGATAYETPRALAAACDVLFTNVSDAADVEEVLFGADGAAAGMAAGGVFVDMSTIAPTAARRIAARLAESGAEFLDAPVSGGEKGAIDGALTFMVGGKAAVCERLRPLLLTMGKSITRIGGSGAGQVAKACNQVIIGATLSGVAESFRLAAANGVDLDKVREALLGGFAGSKVLEVHARRIISGDYTPGFKAALHDKDIGIAQAEAEAAGFAMPSADIFRRRLRALLAAGDGALDSAAVAKVLGDE